MNIWRVIRNQRDQFTRYNENTVRCFWWFVKQNSSNTSTTPWYMITDRWNKCSSSTIIFTIIIINEEAYLTCSFIYGLDLHLSNLETFIQILPYVVWQCRWKIEYAYTDIKGVRIYVADWKFYVSIQCTNIFNGTSKHSHYSKLIRSQFIAMKIVKCRVPSHALEWFQV